MAEVDSSLIKRGFWVDHSQGSVLGATLTMEQHVASIIIALIAVLVSVAASSAWNLHLFATYQFRATPEPKDGLFRQQQVLYRSLATPGSVLVDSLKFLYAWHGRTSRPILFRCLVPALLGLLAALGSLAAGVFSSSIVTTTNLPVLVAGGGCRLFNATTYLDPNTNIDDSNALQQILYSTARPFAEQCYTPGPLPSQCNFYINPRIEPTLDFVDCPFGPSVCMDGVKAATLDSGYLDSNDVFGINAPVEDRVLFRRKATCAPLNTPAHTSIVNSSNAAVAQIAAGRYPPPLQRLNDWWMYEFGQAMGYSGNITYLHSTLASNATLQYNANGVTSYQSSELQQALYTFEPIDDLVVETGDVSALIIYMNHVEYDVPVDDPIYSAHTKWFSQQWGWDVYLADYSAGTLGCIGEYEFCIRKDAQNLECSPVMGSIPNADSLKNFLPSANKMQRATFSLLAPGTMLTGLTHAVTAPTPFLNITGAEMGYGEESSVPRDQWVRDFQAMESFVWAYFQVSLALIPTGFHEVHGEIFVPPATQQERHICHNQKVIKAGGFANVNVFGLAFTLAVCGLFLVLDFVFLRLYIVRGKLKKLQSIQSWIDDGVYELQRRAYELYEGSDWEHTGQEIPVMAQKQLLKGFSEYDKPGSLHSSISSTTAAKGFPLVHTIRPASRSEPANAQSPVQASNVAPQQQAVSDDSESLSHSDSANCMA